jgi:hypothetical protein
MRHALSQWGLRTPADNRPMLVAVGLQPTLCALRGYGVGAPKSGAWVRIYRGLLINSVIRFEPVRSGPARLSPRTQPPRRASLRPNCLP